LSHPVTDCTAGDVIAAFLDACGVDRAFGVISIHNMPILDAMSRRRASGAGRIVFTPARSEQGATNMADAYARVRGALGVAISSTGTAAGNTCGAMVEALTAGSPVLHLTGQIDTPWLDQQHGFIHEARDQPAMLRAVSKAFFRASRPDEVLAVLREAVQSALTAPTGPVSVEIPIDVQAAPLGMPADLAPLPVPILAPDPTVLDALADRLAATHRPLLWLGGGARHAGSAALRLAALGMGIVTSVQGRGIIDESHAQSLGAYHLHPPAEALYETCDALLVAGSRLRSNETLRYQLRLPRPLFRIDVDPAQHEHTYPIDLFVQGDTRMTLDGLADRLAGRLRADPTFALDVVAARQKSAALMHHGLGPYASLVGALQDTLRAPWSWVRDVTISNSTWGNRAPSLAGPRDGVHATGGGIGQGLPMAIGAALAGTGRKVVCLTGDGGLVVNVGELATLVEQQADVTVILMNDRGYGVIRNIQDAHYGGRRCFADLHTPDFALLARSVGLAYLGIQRDVDFLPVLTEATQSRGPILVEVDMTRVGAFTTTFAGPPARK